MSNDIDIFDLQLQLFQLLSKYKRSKKRFTSEQKRNINQNIVFLAEQIRFPFKYFYSDESYFNLVPELRKKLRKYHPSELYDRTLPKLNPILQLDLFWRKNPFTHFYFKGKRYTGPVINIDKYNMLQTSLTAVQYSDAVSYYNAFLQTKSEEYLTGLLAILYTTETYNSKKTLIACDNLDGVHFSIKMTAFFLLQNLIEYITEVSAYKLLFQTGNKKASDKISIGLEGVIYDLAQKGYGSQEEIGQKNLIGFLNMQIDALSKIIAEYRGAKKADWEIAKMLNISINTVSKL